MERSCLSGSDRRTARPPRDHQREPPKKRRPPDRCRWRPFFFFRQPSAEEAFTESQKMNASNKKKQEVGHRNTHTHPHRHPWRSDRHDRGDERVPARAHLELVNAVGRDTGDHCDTRNDLGAPQPTLTLSTLNNPNER